MAEAAASSKTSASKVLTSDEKSLLDQIVEQGRFGAEPEARERGKDLVKEFVAQVLEGSMTVAKDAEMMINARIAQIDHLISLQLNEIMHHASFQKLEGSWRGLKYLMDKSETGTQLKALCSRKFTKKNTASLAGHLLALSSGTTNSASTLKIWRCWTESRM